MFTGLGYEDMETLPNGLTLITSVSRCLLRKSDDWLAKNQDNVSERADITIRGLLFQ
jgi:hypothetical protein